MYKHVNIKTRIYSAAPPGEHLHENRNNNTVTWILFADEQINRITKPTFASNSYKKINGSNNYRPCDWHDEPSRDLFYFQHVFVCMHSSVQTSDKSNYFRIENNE